MKIAMLVHRFPSLSETFIALQISALSQKTDCEIEIFSLGSRGESSWLPKGTEAELQSVRLHSFDQEVKRQPKLLRYLSVIKKYPIAFFKYLIMRNKPVRLKSLVNDLMLLGDMSRFDIVHSQFATIGNNIVAYKKHGFLPSSVKYSCAVRGYDISRKDMVSAINWQDMFEHISLFLPVCHFFAGKLRAMGCERPIAICPSPVNTQQLAERAQITRSEEPVCMVSVGRLTEKKGIDLALRACRRLLDAGIKFEYHVIGGGEAQEMLSKLKDELDLAASVFFHGAWESERVIAFYDQVDLLLAPSKTASNGDSEGIPNVLKEAMVAGVPVVSSRHAGIPELVADGVTGFLCEEDSADDLFRIIMHAVSQRPDWKRIAERARAKVLEEFDPAVCAEKLYLDFNSLLEVKT
ncbi:MAG: hypothetical protein C9356_13240 [Oleiphilus sp.]|nr:MAG: hypothetical protein C9356_13240 [Oleiphilus sp.]